MKEKEMDTHTRGSRAGPAKDVVVRRISIQVVDIGSTGAVGPGAVGAFFRLAVLVRFLGRKGVVDEVGSCPLASEAL
jgi:hypothetical protein